MEELSAVKVCTAKQFNCQIVFLNACNKQTQRDLWSFGRCFWKATACACRRTRSGADRPSRACCSFCCTCSRRRSAASHSPTAWSAGTRSSTCTRALRTISAWFDRKYLWKQGVCTVKFPFHAMNNFLSLSACGALRCFSFSVTSTRLLCSSGWSVAWWTRSGSSRSSASVSCPTRTCRPCCCSACVNSASTTCTCSPRRSTTTSTKSSPPAASFLDSAARKNLKSDRNQTQSSLCQTVWCFHKKCLLHCDTQSNTTLVPFEVGRVSWGCSCLRDAKQFYKFAFGCTWRLDESCLATHVSATTTCTRMCYTKFFLWRRSDSYQRVRMVLAHICLTWVGNTFRTDFERRNDTNGVALEIHTNVFHKHSVHKTHKFTNHLRACIYVRQVCCNSIAYLVLDHVFFLVTLLTFRTTDVNIL